MAPTFSALWVLPAASAFGEMRVLPQAPAAPAVGPMALPQVPAAQVGFLAAAPAAQYQTYEYPSYVPEYYAAAEAEEETTSFSAWLAPCAMLGVAGAVALRKPASAVRTPSVRMQEAAVAEADEAPAPPPLPIIKTMRVGDGTLAGDMNFDPLQISDKPESLAWYREAEIKHARLAMLAAFGWPVSEITNFGNLLTADGRAPSLLNGGLGNVNGAYWAAVVGLAIFAESKGLDKQYGKQKDYLPGMLGFDPLGADSPGMRNAEITNGRVAMVAITLYALQEALTKSAIFPINLLR
jgi:hypothetical protein